jgi:WD40 repeat protein
MAMWSYQDQPGEPRISALNPFSVTRMLPIPAHHAEFLCCALSNHPALVAVAGGMEYHKFTLTSLFCIWKIPQNPMETIYGPWVDRRRKMQRVRCTCLSEDGSLALAAFQNDPTNAGELVQYRAIPDEPDNLWEASTIEVPGTGYILNLSASADLCMVMIVSFSITAPYHSIHALDGKSGLIMRSWTTSQLAYTAVDSTGRFVTIFYREQFYIYHRDENTGLLSKSPIHVVDVTEVCRHSGFCVINTEGTAIIGAMYPTSDLGIWSTRIGALLARLQGHTSVPCSICANPDLSTVITTGQDGTIRVWRLEELFLDFNVAVADAGLAKLQMAINKVNIF